MSDASTTPAAPAAHTVAARPEGARPSRRAHLTVRVLQIVLALFYGIASAPKLIAHSSAVESFDAIGLGDWFMYITGALELAGAIALVIPILSGVSALALIGLMIGALITQLTVFDGQNALMPVVLIVPLAAIAWIRRSHTGELVARVRGRA